MKTVQKSALVALNPRPGTRPSHPPFPRKTSPLISVQTPQTARSHNQPSSPCWSTQHH